MQAAMTTATTAIKRVLSSLPVFSLSPLLPLFSLFSLLRSDCLAASTRLASHVASRREWRGEQWPRVKIR